MSGRKQLIVLAIIVLFCVATRVGWVLHVRSTHPDATLSADSPSYLESGTALARDGSFTVRPGVDHPMLLRTPGYPALIAAVFTIDENTTAFLALQAAMSCLTVLLAFWIARRVWGPAVGLIAAVLLAIEPLQFAASGTLLTESVFSLLLLAVVAVGFRAFNGEAPQARWCALLGLVIALATLVRPTTYYLPIIALLFVVSIRRRGWRTITAAMVALLIPVIAIIGGWQLRNHLEAGSSRYSGIDAVNLYWYYGADAIARQDGVSIDVARKDLGHELAKSSLATCGTSIDPVGNCTAVDQSSPGSYYDLLYRRGLDIVRSHPLETARGFVAGLGREVFGPGTSTVARFLDVPASSKLGLVLGAFLATIYGLFVIGVAFVFRDRTRLRGHAFALVCTAYVLVVSAGPGGYARYRGPIMPILSLYAAYGLMRLVRGLRHRPAPGSDAEPAVHEKEPVVPG